MEEYAKKNHIPLPEREEHRTLEAHIRNVRGALLHGDERVSLDSETTKEMEDQIRQEKDNDPLIKADDDKFNKKYDTKIKASRSFQFSPEKFVRNTDPERFPPPPKSLYEIFHRIAEYDGIYHLIEQYYQIYGRRFNHIKVDHDSTTKLQAVSTLRKNLYQSLHSQLKDKARQNLESEKGLSQIELAKLGAPLRKACSDDVEE